MQATGVGADTSYFLSNQEASDLEEHYLRLGGAVLVSTSFLSCLPSTQTISLLIKSLSLTAHSHLQRREDVNWGMWPIVPGYYLDQYVTRSFLARLSMIMKLSHVTGPFVG